MLLRDLTKVYVSRAEEINDHGEPTRTWKYISTAYFNMQQDVNELDRKSSGEVDYSIYKARTNRKYSIQKGDGISLTNILKSSEFIPDYRVIDIIQIGSSYMYRMEKFNG